MLQTYRKEGGKKASDEIKEGIQRRGKWNRDSIGTCLRRKIQEKKDWKQNCIISKRNRRGE